jgi:ketosteroid isomerase-like protein
MTVLQDFVEFYQQLDTSSAKNLCNIYSEEIVFVDPVSTYKGLPALELYFSTLLSDTNTCHFIIQELNHHTDTAFVTWQMSFSHPKLKKGKLIVVDGTSHILIKDNKIVSQRDYYDLGNMLYEHLPVLGYLVRYLKRKLAE